MHPLQKVLGVLLFLSSFASVGLGQGLTGQISGSVHDPGDAAIVGATVQLTHVLSGQTREAQAGSLGEFVFTQLLPGTYNIRITSLKFKTYEQKDIVVSAAERVALRPVQLEIGQVNEEITVTAEAGRVETQSSERSGLITTRQLENVPLRSRDYLGYLALVAGVIDPSAGSREAPGWGASAPIVQGGRSGQAIVTLDGIASSDTGGASTGGYLAPNVEAIGEVKALLGNYQAEYGARAGGTINVSIKNGTRDFHGSAYHFLRNEGLNARDFFRNRDNQSKAYYRFNNPGFTLGGPVIVPGTNFNRGRNKLFFFWASEWLRRTVPGGLSRLTVPTERERNGEFSSTLVGGKPVSIKDPTTGIQFPGNIIPRDRLDPGGQGVLSLFPLPNASDPGGTYNWLGAITRTQPRDEQILRVDWSVAPGTFFYGRLIRDYEGQIGGAFLGGSDAWPQLLTNYEIWSRGAVGTLVHTFTPTLVNELTFGMNRGKQEVSAHDQSYLDRNNRDKLGLKIPQFYPQANPLRLVPDATFGGVQNAPSLSIETRYPFGGTNPLWNWTDNLSWVRGKHNLKFGIYVENTARNARRASFYKGRFDFGNNANNPLNTGYAYANAVLGVTNSYQESDRKPNGNARYLQVEWYAQDNWKVSRRLTLDIGVRIQKIGPAWNEGSGLSVFDFSLYDRSKQAALVSPYIDPVSGKRAGRDPVSGQIYNASLIGAFAPGSGQAYQGMRVYPGRVFENPPLAFGPRFGLAYDFFGNGRLALRAGFGTFHDRPTADGTIFPLLESPPLVNSPTFYFTTIQQLLASEAFYSPTNVNMFERDFNLPVTYNWSFGLQGDVGRGVIVDVAYVGNAARHRTATVNLNGTNYGTNFLASSIDSTVTGNKPLPVNFLRPVYGFANINYLQFDDNTNYNSLQAQVKRRFGRGLTFGATWTWSKVMDAAGWNSPYVDRRLYYGKATTDRTHNLTVNWSYALPKASGLWNHALTRHVADGWEIAGLATFTSGAPLDLTYSLLTGQDLTGGSGVLSRVNLTGDANLPKSERTELRHFRTDVVQAPLASDFGRGNAPKDPLRGPGINNWDISLFKNIPLGSNEARYLQFRWETYNTFNHTQFSGVDTNAIFDAAGNQTNKRFGQYTSTVNERKMVLALKFYF